MLHRSFKPAKCKTSLKLASSRIKLMKNKREAQVKQLKRELAKLLESGQDQTARIRVEHVVREEKMMAAYDLLEIYSELIVARLPIIESQKNCPIDLKEAISSVIFASPRCADVPELLDVRKHFTAKYGKDFVSAAVELRPDCGVSRLLVEKLSAKAPDGPTKVKILTAIAEEHNIKWDPMSFGEKDSKPSEDLLNGPTTFNSASQMFVNPSYVQPQSNLDDKGPSNLQVPPKSNENQGVPPIFHEHNFRQSSSSQTNSGANKTNMSAAFRPESMPTGTDTERMELRHSYSGDGNAYSMGRQNWNMKFKDAAAAARAAAESAERASMAARAAAELSSRENTAQQYSTGSRRDEEPIRYANSTLQSEHHAKGPIDIVHGRNSWMDYEQINSNQQDDVAGIAENIHGDTLKSTNKSSRSASMKSGATSADGSAFVNNLQMADRYSQKNSSELGQRDNLSEVGLRKQSSRSEVDYASKLQGLDSKSVDDFEEARIRKQPSHASSHSRSHSRSSTFSDDHDVSNYDGLSLGRDLDENPFAADNEGMIRRNSNKTSTPENASVFYDDYVSDQEEFNIDLQGQHKGREYTEFSSHSGNAPTHMFSNSNAWSERQNIDESPGISISRSHFSVEHQSDPVFSESLTSSTVPSQPDEMLPATFDDYDVPISEGEDELDRSKLLRSKDTDEGNIYSRTSEVTQVESHEFMDSSFVDEGNMGSSKPWLQSSSFNSNHVEVHAGRNQGARSSMKFNYGDVTTSQSSPGFTSSNLDFDDPYSNSQQVDERKHEQSQQPSRFSVGHEVRDNVLTSLQVESMEDTETSRESSPESGKELKFANLTGGLRNKGYKRQPYIVNSSHNVSSYKRTAEHTSTKTEERLSAPVKVSPSPGAASQDPYSRDMRSEADRRPSQKKGEENKKSSSRTQLKYFDSIDSDSEDDFPKEALTNKASFNTGLSQRTKISPSNSTGSFYSMATVLSEASPSPDFSEIRNSPPRRVFSHRTSQRPLYQNKISGPLGSSERPRLEEEVGNKPIQESKRPSFKDSLKPSEKEQPSKSLRKIVTSGNTENLNTSSSSGETPSKERASHVHPKLPDYDALTAQLQSLRKNRQ